MSTPGRRAPLARWLPLGIFALGLAVRLVYLAQDAASPWFHYRFVDANDYHKLGVAFAAGHWPADEAFFRPPLYPLLLGVVYRLFGDGIVVVKMLQALVGSATCVLVFWLGRAAFRDRAVGLIAAVITCLCAPLVFYDGQALSANLDVFLFTATALVLIAAQRRDRLRWWAAAGVLIGLGATNRGAMVLIAPAVATWLLLVYRRARAEHAPRWWAAAVVLVVGTLLPIAPVAWHNARYDARPERFYAFGAPPPARGGDSVGDGLRRLVTGRVAALGSAAGVNLYVGNVPAMQDLNREDHPEHFALFEKLIRWPYDEGVTSASQHSKFLRSRTLEAIADAPGAWLALMGKKVLLFFNGVEVPRGGSLYADREFSSLLAVLLWKVGSFAFPTGVLIPLALLGLFLARRTWREHGLLLVALAVHAAFVIMFFVTARYRAPVMPIFAVYAAYACTRIAAAWRARRSPREGAVEIAFTAIALVLCNLPVQRVPERYAAIEHYNLANAIVRDGRPDLAIEHYELATRLAPHDVKILNNLGQAFARLERIDEAIATYDRALAIAPDHARAHYNLGRALAASDRGDEALARYAEAVRLDPGYGNAHAAMAELLELRGDLDGADEHYQRALRIRPRRPDALRGRCRIATARGEPEAARELCGAANASPRRRR